jgi:hypothetical protein
VGGDAVFAQYELSESRIVLVDLRQIRDAPPGYVAALLAVVELVPAAVRGVLVSPGAFSFAGLSSAAGAGAAASACDVAAGSSGAVAAEASGPFSFAASSAGDV